MRLVEKLQQQNLELAGRVGYLQAELSQAREQLALMAPAADSPRGEPVDSVDAPPVESTSPDVMLSQRPWWRFW